MADRDVAVRLSADVAAFVAGMEKAAASTKALGASAKEAQASGAAMATGMKRAGTSASTAATGMATFNRAGRSAAANTVAAGRAATDMSGGMGKAATSSASVSAAFAQQSAAARQVAVAQARLNEVTQRHAAGSSAVLSAQNSLVNAQNAAAAAAAKMSAGTSAAGAAAAGASGRMAGAAAVAGRLRGGFAAAGTAAVNAGRAFTSSTLGIAGLAAAVIAPVKASMDLESAMSRVKATGAVTASQLDALKTASMGMASTFGMSGTQAMGAVEALIKAGVSAKDIIGGGLSGALSLAAAGEMDVSEAAETASSAMTMFGLKGKDVSKVADALSNGANMAQGSVQDLSQALSQGGMVASQMGLNLGDTVGVLAEFANAGLKGSDAGTSLKSMLQQIANPTAQSSKLMAKLGLDFYDAKGNFVGLDGVAGQLQSRMKGLTQEQRNQAMTQIFGSDAVRAASILYKDGAAGVEKWATGVTKAGAAQATAAANIDNLAGDLKKMTAAWQNTFATMGESSQSPLRGIVQDLTNLAGVVERNQTTVATLAKIGAGIAAFAVAGMALSKARAGISAITGIFSAMRGVSAASGTAELVTGVGASFESAGVKAAGATGKVGGFKGALSGLGVSIPGLIVELGALAWAMESVHSSQNADEIKKSFGPVSSWTAEMNIGVKDLNTEMKKLSDGGIGPLKENIQGLGDAMDHATGQNLSTWAKMNDAIGGADSKASQAKLAFSQFDGALTQAAKSHAWGDISRNWKQITDAAKAHNISADKLMKLFPQVTKTLSDQAKQLGATGLSSKDYADWMGGKIPSAVNRAAVANAALAKSLGIIPDRKRMELETVIKGGGKKEIDALNKELVKIPASKQSQVLATAKTKGFKEAMAQARDFEQQAKGLQVVTAKGVKLEIKGNTDPAKVKAWADQIARLPKEQQTRISIILAKDGEKAAKKALDDILATTRTVKTQYVTVKIKYITQDQADEFQKKLAKLPKDQQIRVKATAETKGLDEAYRQMRTLALEAKGLQQYTRSGIKVHIIGNTDPGKVDKLRKAMEGLPKDQQAKISVLADTKGLEAAERQLRAYQMLAGENDWKEITVTAQVKGDAERKIKGIWEQSKATDGKRVFVTTGVTGAKGTEVTINGIKMKIDEINGRKVLIPITQNGAPVVQNALMGVSSAAGIADSKSVTIPTSAPNAPATKSLIDRIREAWSRIAGKSVRIPSSAPGASAATGQLNSLAAAVRRTNGMHATVTASASTGAAQSALRALEATRHMTVVAHVQTVETVGRASGGPIPRSSLASGGRVPGWSPTPTADNVPIMATAGEFMHPVSAVKKYGSGFMEAVRTGRFPVERAQGFANGGQIGAQHLATGGFVGALASSAARTIVVRMAAADGSFADLSRALAAQTAAQRAATRAGNAWRRARGKNRAKAGEAYNKAKDDLKTATDNAQQAIDAFAQSASQAASTMSSAYRSGGSAADLMANMREGTNQLALFESQLSKLRTMGLSQSAIDSITAMGVGQGSAVAGEIVSGGKSMVNSLNLAAYRLDQIADKLGRSSLAKFASGGTVTSPTLALVGEAGAETVVPHTGPMAVQRWYEAGAAIGITGSATTSPYRGSSSGGGTITVAPPVVNQTVLVDLGDLGGIVEGRTVQVLNRTARNVRRSR